MTDAYQPNDPLRRPAGLPPEAEAVFDSPTVPVAATPATGTTVPPITTTPSTGSGQTSGVKDSARDVKDTAKEEAANVGESAKDAAGRVAGTAKDEARNVATEAKQQARQLLDTTLQEARSQASTQQHRAADGLRTIANDLSSLSSGSGGTDGIASQLIGEVGSRVESAASWISEREPADLLEELKRYARRHPVTFIAISGVAGLLVGRLTSGLIAGAKEERAATAGTTGPTYGTTTTGSAYGTGTAYGSDSAYSSDYATGTTGDVTTPRHFAAGTDTWADEPLTGTAADDAIYGTRPTEERGL
ncbi:ElaB/YqjD/DUF883 family membrane-anchored ribosome-binding protein [Agrococcus sp. UYP10]|uniref:hypothetical protein n=1 Tax=Agrococcus sp. UYP10 TaxID=1756355 RepID=UPI00339966E7